MAFSVCWGGALRAPVPDSRTGGLASRSTGIARRRMQVLMELRGIRPLERLALPPTSRLAKAKVFTETGLGRRRGPSGRARVMVTGDYERRRRFQPPRRSSLCMLRAAFTN